MQDLEGIRKKLQRALIEESGVQSVKLWQTAFKLLTFVRPIMIAGSPAKPQTSTQPTRRPRLESMHQPTRPPFAPEYGSEFPSLTDVYGRHEVYPTIMPTIVQPGSSPSQSTSVQDHANPWAETEHDETEENIFSEQRMIGRFPAKIWTNILAKLVNPEKTLSSHQVNAIVAYGQNRATLASEIEELRHPDSTQIWKILSAMECLIYDDDA